MNETTVCVCALHIACCHLLLSKADAADRSNLQGEDADEARERPAWLAGTESAEEGAASPAASGGPSVGLPSAVGSAPGTATAQVAAANGGPADLLDLLGELPGA